MLTAYPAARFRPKHFDWSHSDRVATITLNRPERKNPLTFESYAELRDLFRDLVYVDDIRAVVVTGAGGNFCSGGDVHDIIGPLVKMEMPELLRFTRMTGDLVKAIRACPQPVIAAIDGICAGAGACVAMASDLRYGTRAQQGRVPVHARRPGRLRHGRVRDPAAHHRPGPRRGAAVHRPLDDGRRGRALGLLQPPVRARRAPRRRGQDWRTSWRTAPPSPTRMTKKMLDQEWNMGVDQAIEAEAQAQAICMQTEDFARAYRAFAAKEKPVLRGRIDGRPHASSPGRFFDDAHRALARTSSMRGRAQELVATAPSMTRATSTRCASKLRDGARRERLARNTRCRRPMAAISTSSTSARSA